MFKFLTINWCHLQLTLLLCLVEIVGPSVVNIMAESSSNHGKGIKVRVILLQLACLLRKRKDNLVLWKKKHKNISMRKQTYEQEGEHGLSNIEAMSPVVVGDVTVSLANGVHPSCQGLHNRREKSLGFRIIGYKIRLRSHNHHLGLYSTSVRSMSLTKYMNHDNSLIQVPIPNSTSKSLHFVSEVKEGVLWIQAGFLTPAYCTSAGTLNFSTTPSSKKQRIPHLMSSNSDRGKSLKRNSCNSTVLASGMVDFCTLETRCK